jgi:putative addiction module killer protein
MPSVQVVEYLDPQGRSPHAKWFDGLNAPAAAKVAAALYRLAEGNFSNVKGVGAGVFERKIDFGPGYRIYFGKDGDAIVILLGGGSKQRQQEAIEAAKQRWVDYRRRKSSDRTTGR